MIPLLTAIKGVDETAVNNSGSTPLSSAINRKKVDSVRALLELNVDTTKAVTRADTPPEIVELLRQHKERSVENEKRIPRKESCSYALFSSEQPQERQSTRERVLAEARAFIDNWQFDNAECKFFVTMWRMRTT